MKKLRSNLTKEDIALSKRYVKWYRVVGNEVRLFINEKATNDDKKFVNKIYWKEDRAELCIEGFEYAKKFYEEHKHLEVKFFVKADAGALYSEYGVIEWSLDQNGIKVLLVE